MKNSYRLTILAICFISCISLNTSGLTPEIRTHKEKQVTIAIAQILCIDGDLSGNLVRIENAIVEAREKHAEIIVYPERTVKSSANWPESIRCIFASG